MRDAVEAVLAARRGAGVARWRNVGFTAAVVFHAALATAAIVVPRLTAEERKPLEFVSVEIVPAAALGRPRPPRPEPAPPAPEQAAAEPAPEPAPPEPEPEPAPTLPSPEAKQPEQQPAQRPAARSEPRATPPAPEPRAGSPQGSSLGTSELGNQVLVGDPTFTYGYYLDRVLAAIESQWRRPPTDGVPLQVVLTFRIGRDGRVSELEVADTSGLNAFDLAGLRAVQSASPLPPLPAGYRKDSLAVRLIVR